jgi:hypothetical protein
MTGGRALAQSAVFAGGLAGRVIVIGLIKFWPFTNKVKVRSKNDKKYFIVVYFYCAYSIPFSASELFNSKWLNLKFSYPTIEQLF